MSNKKTTTAINIPFVDDDEEQAMHNGHSNESLSSNDSAERARLYQRSISQRKGANLRIIIDNSDTDNEMEKRDKPGPLISDLAKNVLDVPAMGLRRNSFSMPALNENDLDALRELHMKSMNDEDDIEDMETPEKSSESLSEVQVSSITLPPSSSCHMPPLFHLNESFFPLLIILQFFFVFSFSRQRHDKIPCHII